MSDCFLQIIISIVTEDSYIFFNPYFGGVAVYRMYLYICLSIILLICVWFDCSAGMITDRLLLNESCVWAVKRSENPENSKIQIDCEFEMAGHTPRAYNNPFCFGYNFSFSFRRTLHHFSRTCLYKTKKRTPFPFRTCIFLSEIYFLSGQISSIIVYERARTWL